MPITYSEQIERTLLTAAQEQVSRLEEHLQQDPSKGFGFGDPIVSIDLAFSRNRQKGLTCQWRAKVKMTPMPEHGFIMLEDPKQYLLPV